MYSGATTPHAAGVIVVGCPSVPSGRALWFSLISFSLSLSLSLSLSSCCQICCRGTELFPSSPAASPITPHSLIHKFRLLPRRFRLALSFLGPIDSRYALRSERVKQGSSWRRLNFFAVRARVWRQVHPLEEILVDGRLDLVDALQHGGLFKAAGGGVGGAEGEGARTVGKTLAYLATDFIECRARLLP